VSTAKSTDPTDFVYSGHLLPFLSVFCSCHLFYSSHYFPSFSPTGASPSPRSRPAGILHVPVTIPPMLPHLSTSKYVEKSLPFPVQDSPPFIGPSLQNSTPQSSHPHSFGVGHNRSVGDSARSNRRKKCWKTREDKPSCILGRDITLDRVLGLAEKALVGKFFYARMNMRQLTEWMFSYWKPLLGYCPRFSLLANHWLLFHFLSESDLLRILGSPWLFRKGVLMLKRWRPGFNPHLENFRKRLLLDALLPHWNIGPSGFLR
jgi:hypothetical protein